MIFNKNKSGGPIGTYMADKEEKIARLEERAANITAKIWALGDKTRELQNKKAKIEGQLDLLRNDTTH